LLDFLLSGERQQEKRQGRRRCILLSIRCFKNIGGCRAHRCLTKLQNMKCTNRYIGDDPCAKSYISLYLQLKSAVALCTICYTVSILWFKDIGGCRAHRCVAKLHNMKCTNRDIGDGPCAKSYISLYPQSKSAVSLCTICYIVSIFWSKDIGSCWTHRSVLKLRNVKCTNRDIRRYGGVFREESLDNSFFYERLRPQL
jgi:hypothetical protein